MFGWLDPQSLSYYYLLRGITKARTVITAKSSLYRHSSLQKPSADLNQGLRFVVRFTAFNEMIWDVLRSRSIFLGVLTLRFQGGKADIGTHFCTGECRLNVLFFYQALTAKTRIAASSSVRRRSRPTYAYRFQYFQPKLDDVASC